MFDKAYYNQTVLHPLALIMLIICGLAMLALPRKHALIPMMIVACFISPAQRIAVFTLNFDLLRVMVVFGALRVLARQEYAAFRWNRMDTLLVAWSGIESVAFICFYHDLDAVKYCSGAMYDALGMYFLFRCLVRTWDDVMATALGLTIISFPVALAFIIESFTGRNLFAIFGGVPEITYEREGRLRCQGAFAHSILAGCFWASIVPMMVARAIWSKSSAILSWIGVSCSLLIIFACASSTPVMAIVFGALAGVLFLVRERMKTIRWTVLAILVGLHFVMNKGVWDLMSRIDVVGGSTGWQRYHLIDEAIHHFSDWALLGTNNTAAWSEDLFDITNQYILEGVRGGFLSMCLFIAVIVAGFSRVGAMTRRLRVSPRSQFLVWCLGVMLFVHTMNFLAVSYFGQIEVLWYFTLASISSLSGAQLVKGHPKHQRKRVTRQKARFEPALGRSPAVHLQS